MPCTLLVFTLEIERKMWDVLKVRVMEMEKKKMGERERSELR